MALTKVYDAVTVFKCLHGIINIYKPAGVTIKQTKSAVVHNLCRDLNALQVRQPQELKPPLLESGGAADPILRKLETLDLSDHVLATGPRYQMQDVRIAPVAALGRHTSGVLLFGINRGIKRSFRLQRNRLVRAYHVSGCFGTATETHLPDSRVTMRAKYYHVHPERMNSVAASMQASHQRKMYELCGVDLQSQAAYEIASKGLIRPANNTQPVIYNIKLIEYRRPYFSLEIHAINESEDYLATLVHEMAIELRTVAHCTAIRCIRHGQFSIENSLLRNAWNLQSIIDNLGVQKAILKAHPYMLEQENIELRAQ